MIRFQYRGLFVTAEKTADGWRGPCDLDLSRFPDEAAAAQRLGGTVDAPAPAVVPVAPAPAAPQPAPVPKVK